MYRSAYVKVLGLFALVVGSCKLIRKIINCTLVWLKLPFQNPAQTSQLPGHNAQKPRADGSVPNADPSATAVNASIPWQQTNVPTRVFEGQGQAGFPRPPTWGSTSFGTFDKNYFVQKVTGKINL
jgi:hypothetical protein